MHEEGIDTLYAFLLNNSNCWKPLKWQSAAKLLIKVVSSTTKLIF